MFQQPYNFVYTLSLNLGSTDTYTVNELSAYLPVRRLLDNADAADDGTILDGHALTLYLSPLTFAVELEGLTGADGVAVYSASNSTMYLVSQTAYTGGDHVTLSDGTLTFCFAAGTEIAGPEGATCVEALRIGDLISTADGRAVPVKWIGRQTVQKHRAGPNMQPVRIRAGALGENVPHTDLTVTADHGMMLAGYVVNAGALVNGDTVDFVPMAELPEEVTYYHVETEAHDAILANGAEAETFVDAASRRLFDNYQDYLDLYGAERLIPETRLPRVTSPRLLPPEVRALLGPEPPIRAASA